MKSWLILISFLSGLIFIASIVLFSRVRFRKGNEAIMYVTKAFADFWLVFGAMHLFGVAKVVFDITNLDTLAKVFGEIELTCFAALTVLIFRCLLRLYGKPGLERLAVGVFEVVVAFFVYFMLRGGVGGVSLVTLISSPMVEPKSSTAMLLLNWSIALPALLAAFSNVGYSLYLVSSERLPFRYRQLMISMSMLVVYAMTYIAALGLGGYQLAITYAVALVAIGFGYLGFVPPRRVTKKLAEEEAVATADRLLMAWEEERREEELD